MDILSISMDENIVSFIRLGVEKAKLYNEERTCTLELNGRIVRFTAKPDGTAELTPTTQTRADWKGTIEHWNGFGD